MICLASTVEDVLVDPGKKKKKNKREPLFMRLFLYYSELGDLKGRDVDGYGFLPVYLYVQQIGAFRVYHFVGTS